MGLRYLIAIPGNREEFPAALDTVLARLGLQSIDGDFCCRLYLNMPERWAQFAGGRGFIVGDLFGRSEASEMATAFGGRPAEAGRSEERSVGKEGVSTCRSRWAPVH